MRISAAALELGLQLVQEKLAQAIGAPSSRFMGLSGTSPDIREVKVPPIKDRSVKIKPPKLVTTR